MKKWFLSLLFLPALSFASGIFNPGGSGGGSGSASLPLPQGATNYVQIQSGSAIQTGAFNTSSGSVTNFATNNLKFNSNTNMMSRSDGTNLMSSPDNTTLYFGPGVASSLGTGVFNFASGPSCMPFPGNGNFNSCIGPYGMSNNAITTAENNNSQGYAACGALRAGFYNNCTGGSAGLNLRDGNYNTFNGAYAGLTTVDQNGNTWMGFEAGRYSAASFLTGVGYHAGVGTDTVNASVNDTAATFIGKESGRGVPSATVLNNVIALGDKALVYSSNTAQVGGTFGSGNEVRLLVASATINGFNATDTTSTNITATKITATTYAFGASNDTTVVYSANANMTRSSAFTFNGTTMTATKVSASTVTATVQVNTPALALSPTTGVFPVQGQVWYETTRNSIMADVANSTQVLNGTMFSATTTVTVSNSVVQTTVTLINNGVGTVTIPANFWKPGKTLRITGGGIYAVPALPGTLTVTIKIGTTTVSAATASSLFGGGSNLPFNFNLNVAAQASATGLTTLMPTGGVNYATGANLSRNFVDLGNAGTSVSVVSGTNQDVFVTVQWSNAQSGQTIIITNQLIEVLG